MPTILALEPWLGGSHARLLESWAARSRHALHVLGLPPRHWRWRMEAGAWALAERVRAEGLERPDALFVSDYVDVPRLVGALPAECHGVPILAYFHENQLTYPLAPGVEEGERDLSYGFTNVLSCVAADALVFNSAYHRDDFAAAARALLERLPDPKPTRELEAALERALVIAPGVELDELPLGTGPTPGSPLRIAFNHRFEHDKDPLAFLRATRAALEAGAALELVLLGERYGEMPPGVADELAALGSAVVHDGHAASRAEYAERLGGCDRVVSTTRHEFFGVAVVEGLAVGCTPLVPHRLAYPEVVPEVLHAVALYADEQELVRRLVESAREPDGFRSSERRAELRQAARPYDAASTAHGLDDAFDALLEARYPR